MKKMLKLVFLLILGSCSFFINKIDTAMVSEKDYLKNIPETPTFCPVIGKPKLQLINTEANSQVLFQNFIEKNPGHDFLDQFVMWTLIQMSLRPDQSSPSSRFQVLLRLNSESVYLDFFSETPEEQFPLLFGLDWVLKRYKKKASLESYATILDLHFPQKLKSGKNFEIFLLANQAKIKDHPVLGPFFIRGTEVLKENERMPKMSYAEVIKHYRSKKQRQKIIVNNSLTSFTTESGQQGNCNYDFNLYDNSIFLIDQTIPSANLFGLSTETSAFMASTSQKIEKILPINGFPLFYGESKVRSSAVCMIENQDNRIWTFSNLSRDPGQHLFHLIRYGLARTKSTAEVDKLIRHSRHLFLSDPVRLAIESHRSRKDQIENLLKLNLPIYNAEKLGNIWAYTFFNSRGRFIIDDRNPGSYSCK
jgi:hypothetical protein